MPRRFGGDGANINLIDELVNDFWSKLVSVRPTGTHVHVRLQIQWLSWINSPRCPCLGRVNLIVPRMNLLLSCLQDQLFFGFAAQLEPHKYVRASHGVLG